jgi:hypothetical protein
VRGSGRPQGVGGFSTKPRRSRNRNGPNAGKVAKFEPGVGSPESASTSIVFNGLPIAAWANFPSHGLENLLFLAENAKFLKDLWSTGLARRLTKRSEFNRFAQKEAPFL